MLLTGALAVFDLATAASVRCEPAGGSSVYALSELPPMPYTGGFSLSRIPGAVSDGSGNVRLMRATPAPLQLAGVVRDGMLGTRTGRVFASVDGHLISTPVSSDGRFALAVPGALLGPGTHTVTFDVVAADLSETVTPSAHVVARVR